MGSFLKCAVHGPDHPSTTLQIDSLNAHQFFTTLRDPVSSRKKGDLEKSATGSPSVGSEATRVEGLVPTVDHTFQESETE